MSVKLVARPKSAEDARLAFIVSDDFEGFNTGDTWTSLVSDAGTSAAAGDVANGELSLTTGATDNNEAAVSTTKKVFAIADDKPLVFECLAKYAEANTDDANVFLGFCSAAAANTLVDDGAGPATNFDGLGFYKVDGGTNWNVVISNATTQTKVELTAANSLDKTAKTAGVSAQQRFTIEVITLTSTTAEARFFLDGVLVYKFTGWTFPTNAMFARAYIKAGGSNSEVLKVDRIDAWRRR